MILTSPITASGYPETVACSTPSGDTGALLELLLTWGQSLASGDSIEGLIRLIASLPSSFGCDYVGLWRFTVDDGGIACLYPVPLFSVPPTISGNNSIPQRSLILNSPAAIATELRSLLPDIPAEIRYALSVPLTFGKDCFGLLCLGDSCRPFQNTDLRMANGLSGIIARVLQAQTLHEQQRRMAERQQLLDHIRYHLQRTLNLDELIDRIFAEVNTAIHAEAQSIWLVDDKADMLRCRFATGPGAETVKHVTIPLGEGIVGNTVAKREPMLIPDAQVDTRHSRRADRQTGITTRTLMSVPLVRDGRAIGAIQALNKNDGARFTGEDLNLLQSIADIAVLAIENARLYAALENSYDTMLHALTAALDARDHETEGHSRRVVEYAHRLADQVGITGNDLMTLRRGALIHDIGKIGIPDAILHKPGSLTMEERSIMQKHPQMGYEMLRGVSYLADEVVLVLTHQERWDGSGYPFGLKGEEIPLFSRLFTIADTFDAILSDRPYRKGRSYEVARKIIESEAGKQFEPALVEAFLAVPPQDWHTIRMTCNL